MRIAQVAPLAESVPPKFYGGTEKSGVLADRRSRRAGPQCDSVRQRRFGNRGLPCSSVADWVGTVDHGMPPGLLRPCYEPEGYLAFLGRLSPEKGAEAAIRIARHAKMPLRIAAKVPRDGSRYFKERIEPQLDEQARFVG